MIKHDTTMIKQYNRGRNIKNIIQFITHFDTEAVRWAWLSIASHPEALRPSDLGCRVVCIDHPQIVPQDLLIGFLQKQGSIGFQMTKGLGQYTVYTHINVYYYIIIKIH